MPHGPVGKYGRPRREEIQEAVGSAGLERAWVAVIPIQETEAWVLLDESAIRRAAGKPSGTAVLDLPTPQEVEDLVDPKQVLETALETASEKTGRHLDRVKRRIPALVIQLIRRLEVAESLCRVPAWEQLRNDTEEAIRYL